MLVIKPTGKKLAGGPDLASYDKVVVGFSGGKDSIAAVIELLEAGVPRDKIELWHHDVDGGDRSLMDWPITPAYCRAVAKALGLPIYFSYREGGIEREMLRKDTPTAPVVFETPDGETRRVGGDNWAKVTTRMQFPQVGGIASGRWCSGKVKIEVMESAIRNQDRFDGKRTLVVTGERAEESPSRSKYQVFEPHKVSTRGRHVDAWRPVHGHTEAQVWDSMKRYGIVPHPSYQLGYSRLSCRNCIFGDPDQWATNRKHFPESFAPIKDYERQFNKTIHRTENVEARADKGTPHAAADAQPDVVRLANQHEWSGPVLVDPKDWKHPPGAFKHGCGPT
jgi:3'-phosphoadenosine 5'-phosphosulfate sulfotransferase (PAPS reductase)/FAD synthetase